MLSGGVAFVGGCKKRLTQMHRSPFFAVARMTRLPDWIVVPGWQREVVGLGGVKGFADLQLV